MASPITLSNLQGYVIHRSNFLGKSSDLNLFTHKQSLLFPTPKRSSLRTFAKFDLFQIMGGRGLLNGEKGVEQELKRNVEEQSTTSTEEQELTSSATVETIPEDGFEKEMMGLTGGFPGGETGLKKFIQENPPPPKKSAPSKFENLEVSVSKKPSPPELPLLMPGMIAIVSNPDNPYYMLCGIIQRITDGKAGVLFEGGNWDRLITFRLEELSRREKGPPMKNPRSCILEPLLEIDSK
ncbi:hypothetical protein ACFE04_017233 [Oxalis oulophora]